MSSESSDCLTDEEDFHSSDDETYQRVCTGKYAISFRRTHHFDVTTLGKGDPAARAWNALIKKDGKARKADAAKKSAAELAIAQKRMAWFFATFDVPVPAEAHAKPFVFKTHDGIHTISDGSYGFAWNRTDDKPYPVCITISGILHPCAANKCQAWMPDFFGLYTARSVFKAAKLASSDSYFNWFERSPVATVLKRYDIPAAAVDFELILARDLFIVSLSIGGVIVHLHPDKVGRVMHYESMTPWTRHLLARDDVHAILVDLAKALHA